MEESIFWCKDCRREIDFLDIDYDFCPFCGGELTDEPYEEPK